MPRRRVRRWPPAELHRRLPGSRARALREDQPELVIEEIRNMLARVRTGVWPIR